MITDGKIKVNNKEYKLIGNDNVTIYANILMDISVPSGLIATVNENNELSVWEFTKMERYYTALHKDLVIKNAKEWEHCTEVL